MPIDIDPSKVQWDETPQIDASKVKWDAAPAAEQPAPEQHTGMAGTVAAGLRGMREYLPFARDIGAAANAAGHAITGQGWDFEQEKKRQEEMDKRLAEEHPYAYTAGEVAGGVGSMLAPEAAGLGVLGKGAKAEEAAANLLAKPIGSLAESKIVTGLGSGAISGAAQGAVHGLGTGTSMEERLGHAGEEAVEGAGAGLIGAGVGHGLARGARKVGELAGVLEKTPAAKTAAEIKQASSALYNAPETKDLMVGTAPIRDLYKSIMSELKAEGYHKKLNKALKPALQELKDADRPMSLMDLDKIRRLTNTPAKNWNDPATQYMAGVFRRNFDDFIDRLDQYAPSGKIWSWSGSATDATGALNAARTLWKTGRKTELLEAAHDTAKYRAGSSGSGGNYDNAYRQEIRKIYEKAKKQKGMWTPDEMQAMREFIRGGALRNILRMGSIFDPFHHRSIGAMEVLGGMLNPAHATHIGAGALLGVPAHYGEQYLTKKAGENLENIVKMGGKRASIPRINPMESLKARKLTEPAMRTMMIGPEEDRTQRAAGGKIGNRDYPAKRLTRVERALKRAQDAIALETKPLMQKPDEQIAQALRIAKGE